MKLFLALTLLLTACAPEGQGTQTGNALRADLVIGGEGLAITEARDVEIVSLAQMNVGEVEFSPCTNNEEDELEYPGPYAVDLRDPQPLPEVTLAYDVVCEYEFYIEPDADGTTLYLEGDSLTGQPWTLTSAGSWEYEIEEETTLVDALNRFFVLFDVDAWFDGVDPDDGVANAEGTVVIDGESNTDLLELFEANLADSARLEVED